MKKNDFFLKFGTLSSELHLHVEETFLDSTKFDQCFSKPRVIQPNEDGCFIFPPLYS